MWSPFSRRIGVALTAAGLLLGCAGPSTSTTGRFGQRQLAGPNEARNHYTPVVAILVPGYVLRVDSAPAPRTETVEQGLVWSFPIWFREPDWRHGAAASLSVYPWTAGQAGSLVYRARIVSAPADGALFHWLAGVGAFYDRHRGPGPRCELVWLLGQYGRSAAGLVTAWEPAPRERTHLFTFSLAAFIPYVIR